MNNLPPLRCNDHVSREIHKDRLKKYGGQRDSWLAFWKGLTNQSVWRSKTYSSIKSLFNLLFATRQDYFFLGHAIDSRQGHLDNLDKFPDEGSRVVVGRRSGRATSKGFRVGLHSWRAFHYRVHRFQGHLLHLGKLQREYPPQSEWN